MLHRNLGRLSTISLFLFSLTVATTCRPIEQTDKRIEKTYTDLKEIEVDGYLTAVDRTLEKWAPVSPCGYVDRHGDTIIPIGKYSHCFTDTFKTFAIVFDETNTNSEIVAIDRDENVLFDVYLWDNYPDEISEGLFRVKRNEKIGYADRTGEIIIPCKFECALPFSKGQARVAYRCEKDEGNCAHKGDESEEWFFIDKEGERIE